MADVVKGGGRRPAGGLAADAEDLIHVGQMLLPILPALADGSQLCLENVVQELLDLHIPQAAPLIVGLQLIQPAVFRQELREILRTAEGVQIDEDGVPLGVAGVLPAQVGGVGEHGHDLGADVLGTVGQIDAVAQGLAHLGLAVNARQAQTRLVLGQDDLGIHQGVAIDGVELVDDLLALLQHGQLILAHGDGGGPEGGDVRRLADGIAEEAHGDAGLKVAHLNLRLDGGVALDPGHGDQVHIIEGQLRQLRDHGLDEQGGLLRVQAAGQIVQSHVHDVLADLFRVLGVVGKGLGVGDHDIDLVELSGVLKGHALLQGAHIVARVQAAGGPVAGEDDLFHITLLLRRFKGEKRRVFSLL